MELDVLEESDDVAYNVVEADLGSGENTMSASFYNYKTDQVDLVVSENSLGKAAHEFKHGYQFNIGDTSLQYWAGFEGSQLETNRDFLHGIDDEKAGSRRGRLFGDSGDLTTTRNNLSNPPYNVFSHPSTLTYIKSNRSENIIKSRLLNVSKKYNAAFRFPFRQGGMITISHLTCGVKNNPKPKK